MRRRPDARRSIPNGGKNLSRRELMRRSACLLGAALFPAGASLAAEDVSPVMAKLSSYMSDARNSALPEKVLQETKHHVLDTFAAMISGSELPPGKMALKFAAEYGGPKNCTVVASDVLLGPIEAAIANGELAHSDETDDDYTGGGAHPGSAVVPATLAIGEKAGIGGQHFTRAVALGYDVGMRAFQTVGTGGILKDTHVLVGTFGAAAAAGCAFEFQCRSRCAGCSITRRSRLARASPPGGATPITLKRAFVFGGGMRPQRSDRRAGGRSRLDRRR